jgi:hypothetical protein
LVLLDTWNIAADAVQVRAAGAAGRAGLIASLDDFGRALHGATPESVADEIIAQGPRWSILALAPRLARTPVLTISATHGGAADNRLSAAALRRAGAQVTAREIDSDHPFADHWMRWRWTWCGGSKHWRWGDDFCPTDNRYAGGAKVRPSHVPASKLESKQEQS